MAKVFEILASALLIAAGAAVFLFIRPLQFSFEQYPIYPAWAGWPRDAVALALAIIGAWVAAGSWGGNPETRPVLVAAIAFALAAVCAFAISQIHFYGF